MESSNVELLVHESHADWVGARSLDIKNKIPAVKWLPKADISPGGVVSHVLISVMSVFGI